MHVRRTDKFEEANNQGIEKYMEAVDELYDQLEMKENKKVKPRRVFLASDEPAVITEARQK